MSGYAPESYEEETLLADVIEIADAGPGARLVFRGGADPVAVF